MSQIVDQYVSQGNRKTLHHGVEIEKVQSAQDANAISPPIHRPAKNNMNAPMSRRMSKEAYEDPAHTQHVHTAS